MLPGNFIKRALLFFTCFIGMGCRHHSDKQVKKAFYYWKTNFHLSAFEQRKLDSFACQTLYVRFFDIDWNKETDEPSPVAPSHFEQVVQSGVSYIPVIFITQEVLNRTTTRDLEMLVKNFTNLLSEKCVQLKIHPAEIQIDCDWTRSNKEKYFRLLQLCRQQLFFKEKLLSCTIRLHQVRYPGINGVPPVDKGLLMCYNMGNLRLSGDNNSILDLPVAEKYLSRLEDYPLALDIALPLFSWSLLYDSSRRFSGILRGVQESDLRDSELFEASRENLYSVKRDTLWRGFNLRKGETVRYESCSAENLYQLAKFVGARTHKVATLIFYHCDSTILSKYSNDELEKIYHSFD